MGSEQAAARDPRRAAALRKVARPEQLTVIVFEVSNIGYLGVASIGTGFE
jgi:hypothetical protein